MSGGWIQSGRRGLPLAVLSLTLIGATTPAAARPTDSKGPSIEPRYGKTAEKRPKCVKPANANGAEICVHWVAKGAQKSSKGQVTQTANVFKAVWNREVGALGFRAPLADRAGAVGGRHGKALDVYLADVGAEGTTLGYCEPTKPARGAAKGKDAMAAYCVVDNDFEDFGTAGLSTDELLQATAAHEFFHAVQYAYDAENEPRWLREGTAVWMEEQVYDDLNQAHGYLDTSALTDPQVALDSDESLFPYGAWLFWEYAAESGSPAAIRSVWSQAAKGSAKDSLDAAAAAAAALGAPLASVINGFGEWNYTLAYEEGAAYLQAVLGSRPPLDASFRLSTDDPQTGNRTLDLENLSSGYVRIENADESPCSVTVNAALASGVAMTVLQGSGNSYVPVQNPIAQLPPGASAILVLSNASGSLATVSYSATAACP